MNCLVAASVQLYYAYSADQIYRNTPRSPCLIHSLNFVITLTTVQKWEGKAEGDLQGHTHAHV